MNSEEAIKRFKNEYYKACSDDSIVDPVSYALYMTYLYSIDGKVRNLSEEELRLYDIASAAREQLLLRKKMKRTE